MRMHAYYANYSETYFSVSTLYSHDNGVKLDKLVAFVYLSFIATQRNFKCQFAIYNILQTNDFVIKVLMKLVGKFGSVIKTNVANGI